MSSDQRPQNPGQISHDLPGTTTHITGHDPSTSEAIVQSSHPAQWKPYEGDVLAFNQIYTTNFPADLNGDADIKAHDEVIKGGQLGLAKKGGTVCRQVDFSPGYECMMHRTQSLDYGIVLEGEVEMVMGDGSRTLMRRGDVAVQRATMHAWKNTSKDKWARVQFILQDIQPLHIGGQHMKEDLGRGTEGLPASGND